MSQATQPPSRYPSIPEEELHIQNMSKNQSNDGNDDNDDEQQDDSDPERAKEKKDKKVLSKLWHTLEGLKSTASREFGLFWNGVTGEKRRRDHLDFEFTEGQEQGSSHHASSSKRRKTLGGLGKSNDAQPPPAGSIGSSRSRRPPHSSTRRPSHLNLQSPRSPHSSSRRPSSSSSLHRNPSTSSQPDFNFNPKFEFRPKRPQEIPTISSITSTFSNFSSASDPSDGCGGFGNNRDQNQGITTTTAASAGEDSQYLTIPSSSNPRDRASSTPPPPTATSSSSNFSAFDPSLVARLTSTTIYPEMPPMIPITGRVGLGLGKAGNVGKGFDFSFKAPSEAPQFHKEGEDGKEEEARIKEEEQQETLGDGQQQHSLSPHRSPSVTSTSVSKVLSPTTATRIATLESEVQRLTSELSRAQKEKEAKEAANNNNKRGYPHSAISTPRGHNKGKGRAGGGSNGDPSRSVHFSPHVKVTFLSPTFSISSNGDTPPPPAPPPPPPPPVGTLGVGSRGWRSKSVNDSDVFLSSMRKGLKPTPPRNNPNDGNDDGEGKSSTQGKHIVGSRHTLGGGGSVDMAGFFAELKNVKLKRVEKLGSSGNVSSTDGKNGGGGGKKGKGVEEREKERKERNELQAALDGALRRKFATSLSQTPLPPRPEPRKALPTEWSPDQPTQPKDRPPKHSSSKLKPRQSEPKPHNNNKLEEEKEPLNPGQKILRSSASRANRHSIAFPPSMSRESSTESLLLDSSVKSSTSNLSWKRRLASSTSGLSSSTSSVSSSSKIPTLSGSTSSNTSSTSASTIRKPRHSLPTSSSNNLLQASSSNLNDSVSFSSNLSSSSSSSNLRTSSSSNRPKSRSSLGDIRGENGSTVSGIPRPRSRSTTPVGFEPSAQQQNRNPVTNVAGGCGDGRELKESGRRRKSEERPSSAPSPKKDKPKSGRQSPSTHRSRSAAAEISDNSPSQDLTQHQEQQRRARRSHGRPSTSKLITSGAGLLSPVVERNETANTPLAAIQNHANRRGHGVETQPLPMGLQVKQEQEDEEREREREGGKKRNVVEAQPTRIDDSKHGSVQASEEVDELGRTAKKRKRRHQEQKKSDDAPVVKSEPTAVDVETKRAEEEDDEDIPPPLPEKDRAILPPAIKKQNAVSFPSTEETKSQPVPTTSTTSWTMTIPVDPRPPSSKPATRLGVSQSINGARRPSTSQASLGVGGTRKPSGSRRSVSASSASSTSTAGGGKRKRLASDNAPIGLGLAQFTASSWGGGGTKTPTTVITPVATPRAPTASGGGGSGGGNGALETLSGNGGKRERSGKVQDNSSMKNRPKTPASKRRKPSLVMADAVVTSDSGIDSPKRSGSGTKRGAKGVTVGGEEHRAKRSRMNQEKEKENLLAQEMLPSASPRVRPKRSQKDLQESNKPVHQNDEDDDLDLFSPKHEDVGNFRFVLQPQAENTAHQPSTASIYREKEAQDPRTSTNSLEWGLSGAEGTARMDWIGNEGFDGDGGENENRWKLVENWVQDQSL